MGLLAAACQHGGNFWLAHRNEGQLGYARVVSGHNLLQLLGLMDPQRTIKSL